MPHQIEQLISSIKDIVQTISDQSRVIVELTNVIKADRQSELNLKEAAAFLKVKPKTVRNYLATGKLVGFRKGKFRYFLKSELEDFVKTQN